MTLSGAASLAAYETELDSITYASANATTSSRTILWSVNDGVNASAPVTSHVSVSRLPPAVTAGASVSYDTGATPATLDAGLAIADQAASNLSAATVSISAGFVLGDELSVGSPQAGIASQYNAATGVLTLVRLGEPCRLSDGARLRRLRLRQRHDFEPDDHLVRQRRRQRVRSSNQPGVRQLRSWRSEPPRFRPQHPVAEREQRPGLGLGDGWEHPDRGRAGQPIPGRLGRWSEPVTSTTTGSPTSCGRTRAPAKSRSGRWTATPGSAAGRSAILGRAWQAVGTGDFNDDGNSDILLQNTSTGQVSVWEMDGNTRIGGGPVSNLGPTWQAVGTGDFYGDGNSDILFQNTSTGQVSVWEMDGNTRIGGGPVSNLGPTWKVVGTGDFNGDGNSDILLQNTSTGQVSIWEMDGNTRIGGGPVSNLGPSWHAIAPVGGGSDILFQNASTGQVSIWEMDGNTRIGGGPVSNLGPTWHAIQA